MDVVEALHLIVDVASGVRSVLNSQEAQVVKDAIEKHFHPKPAEPAPEPVAPDPTEQAPEPAPGPAFGQESNPYPPEV